MKRVIITLLVVAASLLATTPTLFTTPPDVALIRVEIKPVVVPTSSAVACAKTIWVDTITLSNTTGSPVTVTFSDQQTIPVQILPTVSLAANSFTVLQVWGLRMDGGFTWVASGAGVNGFFKGKIQQ